jgi:xanthine/uracil permease
MQTSEKISLYLVFIVIIACIVHSIFKEDMTSLISVFLGFGGGAIAYIIVGVINYFYSKDIEKEVDE